MEGVMLQRLVSQTCPMTTRREVEPLAPSTAATMGSIAARSSRAPARARRVRSVRSRPAEVPAPLMRHGRKGEALPSRTPPDSVQITHKAVRLSHAVYQHQ